MCSPSWSVFSASAFTTEPSSLGSDKNLQNNPSFFSELPIFPGFPSERDAAATTSYICREVLAGSFQNPTLLSEPESGSPLDLIAL